EDPEVPNWGRPKTGVELRPGMTICIEPIINSGSGEILTEKDGWTTRTRDGKLSAHFEHQILITENEPEILTSWDRQGISSRE
ncbi:MAG: M24 family metallopeptidase, partial [Patescibacteria group bacterium]